MKKPVVLYVDDEPQNLTIFEAAFEPDQWEIVTYDNPVKALENIDKIQPWVVVSDQRMPGMMGVQFLEITRKIQPHAIRIIVTGYSDEALVVESVRKAHVFDYIKKPWDVAELEATLRRGVGLFETSRENRLLQEQLQKSESELKERQTNLILLANDLEVAQRSEFELRKELECWVPPFVRWALEQKIKFPVHKDLVGITFDLIKSRDLHGKVVDGKSIRSVIIQNFSEIIIKHGGWRESHSGDSAYGHFGLFNNDINPFEAALAVAREFRVALRGLSTTTNISVECGIALHLAKESVVDVHTAQILTPGGVVIQKSFDTTSKDIDVLHRMEKVVHTLPGTNIILSRDFVNGLNSIPPNIKTLGFVKFPDLSKPLELCLFRSDLVGDEELDRFIQNLTENDTERKLLLSA